MTGRYLIATVGTTPALLEKTIIHHHPDGVVLIASPQTLATTEAIDWLFEDRLKKVLLVNDAEDWDVCYKASGDALAVVMQWSQDEPAIIVDLTGGTKIMSTGLALALHGRGVTWSYVGGKQREDGTGRAITGHENIRVFADPVASVMEHTIRALGRAWNEWQFEEAQSLSQHLRELALQPQAQDMFNHLGNVLQGFAFWDRFQYQEALIQL